MDPFDLKGSYEAESRESPPCWALRVYCLTELGPALKALLVRQDELVAELVRLLNDARRT